MLHKQESILKKIGMALADSFYTTFSKVFHLADYLTIQFFS